MNWKTCTTIFSLLACLNLTACVSGKTALAATEETEVISTTEIPTESISDNPLVAAGVSEFDLLNGSLKRSIGKYAKIFVSKSELRQITMEQYTEFCQTVLVEEKYNWVSIVCDDGTGIQFIDCDDTLATYGNLDSLGRIASDKGYISKTLKSYEYKRATLPTCTHAKYISSAEPLPSKVFEPQSDSPQAGSVFIINGTVSKNDTVSSDDPNDNFTIDRVYIQTDDGTLVVANIYKALYDALAEDIDSDHEATLFPDPLDDYILPKVGEEVRIIGIYADYSDILQMPVFYYGACDSMYTMLRMPKPEGIER